MRRDTILIVDDVEVNRLLLEEIFKNVYRVLHADNGKRALEVLNANHEHIAAILLDLEMPVMSGFEFLETIAKMPIAEKIPIIVISVDDTNSAQIRALDYGVVDVVKKPYNPKVVLKRVKNAVSLADYRERLENTVEEQTYRLEEKERELSHINENLIDALSSIVEFRDLETGEHIKRIKDYTRLMCNQLLRLYPDSGLKESEVDYIVRASAMHDIGKIAIPDAILLKPGRLTPEEFDVIKTHTIKGGEILDRVEILNSEAYMHYCKNICLYHHEKYDGKGYPKGLSGEEIPLEAQIVSVADVFDALVSKRIYKDAYSVETAFDMIRNGECGKFSDRIMKCFSACFDDFKTIALDSYAKELKKIS